MTNSEFTAEKISLALIVSGLLHLLLFYWPDVSSVYEHPAERQLGHIEIELTKSSLPTTLPSENNAGQVSDMVAKNDSDPVMADIDSQQPGKLPAESTSSAVSHEPIVSQDKVILQQEHSSSVVESPSAASRNDPSRLLSLIYTEINKHKHYPYVARRQGREGLVKLNFVMHPDGEVTDIAIVQTSHFSALDNAARNAVQAISPFHRAAEFLDSYHRYDVNIDFRLN